MKYRKFFNRVKGDVVGYESATPEIVAKFLAEDIVERLKQHYLSYTSINIIDCCCGIGSDTLAFSKVCNFVLSVDKDKNRIEIAKENVKNFKNMSEKSGSIKFITEDIFNLNIRELKVNYGLNVAFADPQRRLIKNGRFERTRNLTETSPNTINLINFLRAEIPNMCILSSSNAELSEVLMECEKEYITWEGRKGKRETLLAMYFGDLKRGDVSTVVLPGKDRLCRIKKKNEEKNEYKFLNKPKEYIYEIKDCVVKANLQNELSNLTGCEIYSEKFLTSEALKESNFFENKFKILCVSDRENLIENLRKLKARKVVIRGRMSPEEHKKMKTDIEARQKNFEKEKIHIFLEDNDKILIGKNIDLLQD